MYSLFWQMVPIRETFAQLTFNQLHPISFHFFCMLHFEVCVENIHSICIVWMLYSECIKWAIMFNLPNNTKQINNFDLCCALWDTCKLVQWLFHQHSVVLFTCKRPLLVYSQLSPSKWVHHKMFNDHFTADFTLFSNTYYIALTLAYKISSAYKLKRW